MIKGMLATAWNGAGSQNCEQKRRGIATAKMEVSIVFPILRYKYTWIQNGIYRYFHHAALYEIFLRMQGAYILLYLYTNNSINSPCAVEVFSTSIVEKGPKCEQITKSAWFDPFSFLNVGIFYSFLTVYDDLILFGESEMVGSGPPSIFGSYCTSQFFAIILICRTATPSSPCCHYWPPTTNFHLILIVNLIRYPGPQHDHEID